LHPYIFSFPVLHCLLLILLPLLPVSRVYRSLLSSMVLRRQLPMEEEEEEKKKKKRILISLDQRT